MSSPDEHPERERHPEGAEAATSGTSTDAIVEEEGPGLGGYRGEP